jgi:hypothetical protein
LFYDHHIAKAIQALKVLVANNIITIIWIKREVSFVMLKDQFKRQIRIKDIYYLEECYVDIWIEISGFQFLIQRCLADLKQRRFVFGVIHEIRKDPFIAGFVGFFNEERAMVIVKEIIEQLEREADEKITQLL